MELVIEKIAIQNLLEHTAKRTVSLQAEHNIIVATILFEEQRYVLSSVRQKNFVLLSVLLKRSFIPSLRI